MLHGCDAFPSTGTTNLGGRARCVSTQSVMRTPNRFAAAARDARVARVGAHT
jgi:hypothetical protein